MSDFKDFFISGHYSLIIRARNEQEARARFEGGQYLDKHIKLDEDYEIKERT